MIIFTIALVVSRVSHNVENLSNPESIADAFSRDFLLGIAYAVALVGAGGIAKPIAFARFHAVLADFSYSTYLCHFPAMVFAVAVMYAVFGQKFQLQPRAVGVAYVFALTFLLYAYCYAVFYMTERHKGVIRLKVARFLKGGA